MTSKKNDKRDALNQFLKSLKQSVQEDGMAFLGLSPQELDDVRDALISGAPLFQILGMDATVIEGRYALAHQLYSAGKYSDAETVFRWLSVYANTEEAHWMGLGACRQALENYDGALEAYQMAALYSSLEDPAPFYYSAICLLKQGKREDASVSLQAVLALGNANNAEHKTLIDKAETVLAGLH